MDDATEVTSLADIVHEVVDTVVTVVEVICLVVGIALGDVDMVVPGTAPAVAPIGDVTTPVDTTPENDQ
jgi:hypothetical protein